MTFCLAALVNPAHGFATTNAPQFKEVYDLIKSNSVVTDAELNRAAVMGLLDQLGPKANLVTNGAESQSLTATQVLSRTFVFDGEIAYLRIASVSEPLPKDLRATFEQLGSTNKLKGLVLDLRYADGGDYSAALNVAEMFPMKKAPTLNWGGQSREIAGKSLLTSVPLVVLVNADTARAAEALAAMLQDANACLLLGSPTAGRALMTKDFKLSNGETLQIATSAVKLNGVELSHVTPDIKVNVSPKAERSAYDTDFLVLPKVTDVAALATNKPAATNFVLRRPRNEAELVRAHREGLSLDEIPELPDVPTVITPPPAAADAVLSRAVDLLKGLAIVRQGTN